MLFKDLNLSPEILKNIERVGYTQPTPIQVMAIPEILKGSDIRASAQTGTGKTAAFVLPALHKLLTPSTVRGHGPRIVILVPTRELAIQVAEEATKYSLSLPRIKTVCIYGGAPYPAQNRMLSRPYEILVATPGRLIDHIERGKINFDRVEMFILDEADRMLDMGFIDPVEQIAKSIPSGRQTLMFSATLKGQVLNLSKRLLNNPVEISISQAHDKHENIDQRLHYVDNLDHKYRLLDHFLNDSSINQAIIFTATKNHAGELMDKLCDKGFEAAALHGDMDQRQRTRTITKLREGKVRFLVATDVAARGIDIQSISHVFNFDLPMNSEDYVHRIGRTGRAGAKGIAMSFVASKDLHLVKRIESFTGQTIEQFAVPGMEAGFNPANKAKPHFKRSGSSRGFGGGGGGGGQRNFGGGGFKRPANKNSYESHDGTSRGQERRPPIKGWIRNNQATGPVARVSDRGERDFDYGGGRHQFDRSERFERQERFERSEKSERPERPNGARTAPRSYGDDSSANRRPAKHWPKRERRFTNDRT